MSLNAFINKAYSQCNPLANLPEATGEVANNMEIWDPVVGWESGNSSNFNEGDVMPISIDYSVADTSNTGQILEFTIVFDFYKSNVPAYGVIDLSIDPFIDYTPTPRGTTPLNNLNMSADGVWISGPNAAVLSVCQLSPGDPTEPNDNNKKPLTASQIGWRIQYQNPTEIGTYFMYIGATLAAPGLTLPSYALNSTVPSGQGSGNYGTPFQLKITQVTGNKTLNLSSPTILPVTFGSFNVTEENRAVSLSWETENETNNVGFYIERRSVISDAYEQVGFVEGNGDSNITRRYEFIDNTKKVFNEYYYRLRQADYDGLRQFSEERKIVLDPIAEIEVFPNPSNGDFTVIIPENFQDGTMQLIDLLGRVVYSQNYQRREFLRINNLEINQFGIYTIILENGNGAQQKQILIGKY